MLEKLGVCGTVLAPQWRARSMTAAKMAKFDEEYNLQCVSQELVTWETRFLLVDCLSTRPARIQMAA